MAIDLRENNMENNKELLGRSINGLDHSTEKECKKIIYIINENFTKLIKMCNGEGNVPRDLCKEYRKIVSVLKEQKIYSWAYYFNTIESYGIDNIKKFNVNILNAMELLNDDDLFNEMVKIDDTLRSIYFPSGTKD